MGKGHCFSPVQRRACLPAYRPGRHVIALFDRTIIFNIRIVNNLNVEYRAFIPTRVRAGFFEEIDMTTQTIRSEVTGTVWKIVAQAGDALEADDTIMILESMKMEIPVVAPEAGRVVELLVAEGAPVREGQEVAVFEDA
jgi:acetyl-CoA carboxylase biotin carboxyl carrier protein